MKKLEIGPRFSGPIDNDWDTLDIVERKGLTYLSKKEDPFVNVPKNYYDLVYMSHILEHVPWYTVVNYLKGVCDILKIGGSVEIWVPDFDKLIRVYLKEAKQDNWKGPAYLREKDKNKIKEMPNWNSFQWVLGRIFAYQDSDSEENFHKGAFNYEHLADCLSNTGFVDIEKLEKPRAANHGWINMGVRGIKK